MGKKILMHKFLKTTEKKQAAHFREKQVVRTTQQTQQLHEKLGRFLS